MGEVEEGEEEGEGYGGEDEEGEDAGEERWEEGGVRDEVDDSLWVVLAW